MSRRVSSGSTGTSQVDCDHYPPHATLYLMTIQASKRIRGAVLDAYLDQNPLVRYAVMAAVTVGYLVGWGQG
jgi:hypothetical protein